jgi:hypothetical protein
VLARAESNRKIGGLLKAIRRFETLLTRREMRFLARAGRALVLNSIESVCGFKSSDDYNFVHVFIRACCFLEITPSLFAAILIKENYVVRIMRLFIKSMRKYNPCMVCEDITVVQCWTRFPFSPTN